MAKKVWITALSKKLDQQSVMATCKTYALDRGGHYWVDKLDKQAWIAPLSSIIDEETKVWIILSSKDELASPSIRFGLSLLTLSVQAVKGHGFPIILAHTGNLPVADDLPTPLRGAQIIAAGNAALGVKIVARANATPPAVDADYRLDVQALPHGVCFELGPVKTPWNGAIFGVSGEDAGIEAQAVGPKDDLPETSVLNFPSRDMKLDLGERSFTAWALKNKIELDSSYYAVIRGEPDEVLFGPFVTADDEEQEELELFRLQLK